MYYFPGRVCIQPGVVWQRLALKEYNRRQLIILLIINLLPTNAWHIYLKTSYAKVRERSTDYGYREMKVPAFAALPCGSAPRTGLAAFLGLSLPTQQVKIIIFTTTTTIIINGAPFVLGHTEIQ